MRFFPSVLRMMLMLSRINEFSMSCKRFLNLLTDNSFIFHLIVKSLDLLIIGREYHFRFFIYLFNIGFLQTLN